MPEPKYVELQPNSRWPEIISEVLGDGPTSDASRALMWFQVLFYVETVTKLPIGPLADDPDVRREVSMRVMDKLEKKSYSALREWLQRQQAKKDCVSWWSFVKMLARSTSIDVARSSRKNVGSRTRFEWVREESVDPFILSETLDGTLSHSPDASEQSGVREMYDRIAGYQEMLADTPVVAEHPEHGIEDGSHVDPDDSKQRK